MGLHTSTPEGASHYGVKINTFIPVCRCYCGAEGGGCDQGRVQAGCRRAGRPKAQVADARGCCHAAADCGVLMRLSATKMDSISSAKSALITLLLLPQCSASSVVHSKAVASCGQWRWNPGPSMKYGELAYKTRHTFQLLNFLYLNPAAAYFERHLAATYLCFYLYFKQAISIFVVCTVQLRLLKSFDDLGRS